MTSEDVEKLVPIFVSSLIRTLKDNNIQDDLDKIKNNIVSFCKKRMMHIFVSGNYQKNEEDGYIVAVVNLIIMDLISPPRNPNVSFLAKVGEYYYNLVCSKVFGEKFTKQTIFQNGTMSFEEFCKIEYLNNRMNFPSFTEEKFVKTFHEVLTNLYGKYSSMNS